MLVWKYFEFGACETAIVQLSSLLFIMSDGVESEKKQKLNTFLREQWSCLISQLGNQLGAYYSSFAFLVLFLLPCILHLTLLWRFHYFEGIRQRREEMSKIIIKKSADVGFNLDSSMMIQHADIW